MPNYQQGTISSPFTSLTVGDLGYSFGAVGAVNIATRANNGLARNVALVNGGQQIQVVLNTVGAAAHKWQVGQNVVLANTQSSGGTNFDGNYEIISLPTTSSAVLIPLDPIRLYQAADTGGLGTATAIQGEQPVVPQAGQAFAIKSMPTQAPAAPLCFDGSFDGAPGTFEVDCQIAEVDSDANYITPTNGNITAVDATNNNFHFELLTNAKFARMKIKSRANAVNFIGIIKR